jgi:hypothetical protein
MSLLLITAGSTFHIGAALAFQNTDFTAADFTSQDWTPIDGLTNLGTAGDSAELVTSNQIGSKRVRKGKGVRNSGTMEVVVDLNPSDPGQLAMIAAEKTRNSFAFKLAFDDAPSGGTPSTRLFTAFVMSAAEAYDEANSVMKLNFTLEVDSNFVRVPAAGGA